MTSRGARCGSQPGARYPLCLDILCVLASAGGKVVSKDERMERVWAGVVNEENNIQVHISALRKALEEDKNGKGGTAPR